MRQVTKFQHFVPRLLLKQFRRKDKDFGKDKERVWAYFKDSPEKGILSRLIKSEAGGDEFFYESNRRAKNSMEKWLKNNVEDPIVNDFSYVLSNSKNDFVSLGSDQIERLAKFIAVSNMRTPFARSLLRELIPQLRDKYTLGWVIDYYSSCGLNRALISLPELFETHDRIKSMLQLPDIHLDMISEAFDVYSRNIIGYPWVFLRSEEKRFIISDIGSLCLKDMRIMPISTNLAIAVLPKLSVGKNYKVPIRIIHDDFVLDHNRLMLCLAKNEVYGSRKKEICEAFTDQKWSNMWHRIFEWLDLKSEYRCNFPFMERVSTFNECINHSLNFSVAKEDIGNDYQGIAG